MGQNILLQSIVDAADVVTENSSLSTTLCTNQDTRCHFGSMTDRFGILVQFLLALLAFSCLIVKRFCEPIAHRRPWLVWFYDTSKQGFGAAIIHIANIFLARTQCSIDPCICYVMNFLLDSTVGLLFIYIALRLLECTSKCCSCKTLRNGEYGDPPKCSRWFAQCLVYSGVMVAEKGVIIAVTFIPIWLPISRFLMSPIKSDKVELVLVMFVIPIVVNALIFWVVDNFLMKNLRLPTRSNRTKYSKLKGDVELEEKELNDALL